MKKPDIYSGINIIIAAVQIIFLILFLFFSSRVINPEGTRLELLVTFIISLSAIAGISFIKNQKAKAAAQIIFVFSFFAYFYELSSRFQLILHRQWQDQKLIIIDKYLFGGEVSILMQQIVTPYLTEAMMFGYIMYFPLLLITAFAAYYKSSGKGLSEYLFILSLAYILCYFGFILMPVAGQMYFSPEQYSVPLEGGFFTYLGELIRSEAHFPGGNLPSPHCAAATVMLYIFYKYQRKLFYILLPTILLLYFSTVYCRYHYFWDAVTGILLPLLLISVIKRGTKIFEMIFLFYTALVHNPSVSESLSEN
jgi:hypothetical protein